MKKIILNKKQIERLQESIPHGLKPSTKISKNFKKGLKGTNIKTEGEMNEDIGSYQELYDAVVNTLGSILSNESSKGLDPVLAKEGLTWGEFIKMALIYGLLTVGLYQGSKKVKVVKDNLKGKLKKFVDKLAEKRGLTDKPKVNKFKEGTLKEESNENIIVGADILKETPFTEMPKRKNEITRETPKAKIPSIETGDASVIVGCIDDMVGATYKMNLKGKEKTFSFDGYLKDFMEKYGEEPKFVRVNENQFKVINEDFSSDREQYLDSKEKTLDNWGTTESTGAASSGAYTGPMFSDTPHRKKIKIGESQLKLIKEKLRESELDNKTNSMEELFLKRVPFLKDYEIHKDFENGFEARREAYNKDVKHSLGGKIVNFPQYNIVSNFKYTPIKGHDETKHIFTLENKTTPIPPEDMGEFEKFMISSINQKSNENLSYSEEIVVPKGEIIPKDKLDGVFNNINRSLFELENVSNNLNIPFFN